jgi:predicted dehydrogenase
MSQRFSRRTFVKSIAYAGAAAPLLTPRLLRAEAANSKLTVAFIGTGGMGGNQAGTFHGLGVDCTCYCDVNSNNWGTVHSWYPNAKGYQDYRKMFDEMHKQFDAVTVGIPDHHHFPATVLALQHDKSSYTQKPLTHTVWESRMLAKLAADHPKVATQMGNQGHGNEGWRAVYEWVHGDAIGEVTEVHSWTNRPDVYWKQGFASPTGEDPVPNGLDWDIWLGPAPKRPFKKDTYIPLIWRGFWDFGAGALGDMACHTMDSIFAILAPGYPQSVEVVKATEPTKDVYPRQSIIKWSFPKRDKFPALACYWYDGKGNKPERPVELEAGVELPETGNLYVGTKGKILIAGDYCDSYRIIPRARLEEVGKPKHMLERSPGNYVEFVEAAKGNKPPEYCGSRFAYSAPMTETILLGNVALKVGGKLDWDGPNLKVTNHPEADILIHKEYRDGWKMI